MNKKISTSLVASLLIATNVYATEELTPITVTSTLINTNEKDATYSTEIYTKDEIEKSKSKDIYDFLSSQTSVNIAPNYGNTFSQKIDLRGYGIGDGYQNVVVSVNGRKLNNIDLTSQLLSSISLDSIDKIEIIKGSGSVQYGDGANAGVINILTNGKNENYIQSYFGNNGTKSGTLSLGHSNDNIILNALVDYTSTNGTRNTSDGSKDENYKRNKNINLIYFPTDDLELRFGRTYSNMNIKYGGSLTLAEYTANPNQTTSSLTSQYFRSYVTDLGATYSINKDYSIDFNFSDENKLSEYSSGFKSNYDYKSFNSQFNIEEDRYKIVLGVDGFDGDRVGSSDTTMKDNKALYLSGEYNLSNNLTISAGMRRENIEYTYKPNSGSELEDNLYLNAYDIGVNYRLNDTSSFFANYNKSYQAPDIDRFFASVWVNNGGVWTSTTSFNGFIEPSKVKNYNLGYTNIQNDNKLKITLFRSNLKNEIYLYKAYVGDTGTNKNIDKTHKYGVEFFDKYLISNNLYTSINYSYIIAKIDEEADGNGAYNGKYLPGVSKHNVTLNLGYTYDKIKTILSHTYRSSSYAAEDFENNFSQKQEAYNTTDLSFSYNYKSIEFFTKVQNLFDQKNGLWIKDDSIYPVNFERTYYAGMKYKF